MLTRASGRSFLYGAGATFVAMFFSLSFFTDSLKMATSGLISISLIFYMHELLDKNRDTIWIEKRSPWSANASLAAHVALLFMGMFTAALITQVSFPSRFLLDSTQIESRFENNLYSLLSHNIAVLVSAFVLSVVYRAGGLLLILAWNAINWSTTILVLVGQEVQIMEASSTILYMLAILPHLVLEVVSYTLGCMSGLFLSKAFMRYQSFSQEFYRVSRACLAIFVLALVVLFLAGLSEIFVAQPVFFMSIRSRGR